LTPEAKAASKAARSTPEALQKRRQYRTQEQIRERERAYAKRPDVRLRKLGRQYKIGAAELLRLMREQDGKCAVCGDPLGPGRGTHVDHDHETGQVRGLLCRDCNLAEGMLHGSALRARKLAAYIEKHAPQLRLVNP
jgi:5-methylcytosine-specific restriction endonuclease McrA